MSEVGGTQITRGHIRGQQAWLPLIVEVKK